MNSKSVAAVAALLTGAAFLSFGNLDYLRSASLAREGFQQDLFPSPSLSEGGKQVDVNAFLEGVIENFREDMLVGIPEIKVPVLDPFSPKKPVKVDVEDSKASLHGNFTNIKVEGLSGFNLVHLNADLQNLSLEFNLMIPWISAVGNYTIDGKVIKIVPVRGSGAFKVESHNLTLAAKASLENAENNRLQLSKDFDVTILFDKVELNLENFLGGGRWTEVLLKILNDVSKDLFTKCLPLLKGELNKSLLKVLNKHLMKLPITSIVPSSSANDYVDQILDNVQVYVRDNDLDPMQLPDYAKNFSKSVMAMTFNGEAKLYDGWLQGVSSLHRSDDCDLQSNKTTITISAHLGLTDLRLSYKGHAKFMSWGPSLMCGGSVKKVSFYFRIVQKNKKGAKPHLECFEIVELSTIWVELSGLGPLTWILKWLLTGISKMVEDFIVDKVTFYVRENLQEAFEKLPFPV